MINCLIVIDRDGTLIEKHDYLGKSSNWKSKVKLIDKTVFLLKALDVLFPNNLKIVFTNQTGVALGFFSEKRVKEINSYVNSLLESEGVEIEHWIYSPEADECYASEKGIIENAYVKKDSSRKPNPRLLIEKLKSIHISINFFEKKIVIGDSEEDRKFAENIDAFFIPVDN